MQPSGIMLVCITHADVKKMHKAVVGKRDGLEE